MTQWAVVFFANGVDQTMDDAVGPFRNHDRASEAMEKLEPVLHEGATLQVVRLHTLREAVEEFADPKRADSGNEGLR